MSSEEANRRLKFPTERSVLFLCLCAIVVLATACTYQVDVATHPADLQTRIDRLQKKVRELDAVSKTQKTVENEEENDDGQ